LYKYLLELVEIRTKLASVLPMFIGLMYALWLGYPLKPFVFLYLFLSVISIDMTATALNNYFDYKRAKLKTGYHYEHHNPIASGKLSPFIARMVIYTVAIIGITSGLLLVYVTNWLILLLGIVAFGVAISYSFGPLPISRTPLGELISGLFMGLLIPFIAGSAFIPLSDLLNITYNHPFASLSINVHYLGGFLFLGLPLFCLIANIMLANNTCDRKEDLVNMRYTLPVLIGKHHSLWLFKFLFFSSYAILIIGWLSKLLPAACLVTNISLIKTYPLMKAFINMPDKHITFVNAVKIFAIFSLLYGLGLLIALVL